MAQRYVRIFRFVVNFRLWHPALSLEAISTEFGTVLKLKDDFVPGRGIKRGMPPLTYWSSESASGEDEHFIAVIRRFVELLESKASFLEDLATKGGQSELFVGWFQSRRGGGVVVPSDLLGRLGKLRVDLSLDVYGTGEEPDDLN